MMVLHMVRVLFLYRVALDTGESCRKYGSPRTTMCMDGGWVSVVGPRMRKDTLTRCRPAASAHGDGGARRARGRVGLGLLCRTRPKITSCEL